MSWSKLNRDISGCEKLIIKSIQFSGWIAQLSSLNPEQRDQLRSCLSVSGGLLQDVIKVPSRCPHCQSGELRPWGFSGDLPRYRCKVCGKTSNALTGTPMARLRKRHLWHDYAGALTESLSVRKAANIAASVRTQLFFGGTGFSPGLPIIKLSMHLALSKPMKPSSWSPSKVSETCPTHLASAEEVLSNAGCPRRKFRCWW